MNKIWLTVISIVILAGIILIDVSGICCIVYPERSPTWRTLDEVSDLEPGETLTKDLGAEIYCLKLVDYKFIRPESMLTIVREDYTEVYRAPIAESWEPLTIKYDHSFTLNQSGRYFIDVEGLSGFTFEILYATFSPSRGPGRHMYPYRPFLAIGIIFVILGGTIVCVDLARQTRTDKLSLQM